eukprot:7170695-Pyramimonas_sp.AAC.1
MDCYCCTCEHFTDARVSRLLGAEAVAERARGSPRGLFAILKSSSSDASSSVYLARNSSTNSSHP